MKPRWIWALRQPLHFAKILLPRNYAGDLLRGAAGAFTMSIDDFYHQLLYVRTRLCDPLSVYIIRHDKARDPAYDQCDVYDDFHRGIYPLLITKF